MLRARRLDWPDCQNARDLGGLPLRGGTTRFGALIRSDHLGNLNAAGRSAMIAYGVTTVIDLRSEREVAADGPWPAGGLKHVNVPIVDDASLRELGETPDMLERYLETIHERRHAFRDVFSAVAEADGTVLFHCFAGKDRTGVVAAMMLALAGVDVADIAEDFAETDRRLASRYELWIAAAPAGKREAVRSELVCPPERIAAVLDHLERGWGGVAGYLAACGLAPAAIDRVAARLA